MTRKDELAHEMQHISTPKITDGAFDGNVSHGSDVQISQKKSKDRLRDPIL